MGAHQKIDRVARNHLKVLAPSDKTFPGIRMILQFEGKNGPDGIKRKSPARDEPWHYFDPFDEQDTKLLGIIDHHFNQLVQELRQHNRERAAFEAAWLAHALVDGLTPAHHYPYEEKLIELRGGEGIEGRTSIRKKLLLPGDNKAEQLKNNWKMWGGKGLMMTHGTFEIGIASLIAPLKFIEAFPHDSELRLLQKIGYLELFKRTALEIARLDMYERYYEKGWTPRLASQVRGKLAPSIIRVVTLTWYSALLESKKP